MAILASAERAARASAGVALPLDPTSAEDQGLDLLLAEHERRQKEARAQQIPDARPTVDRRAERNQRLHVPIDGAYRDGELAGEMGSVTGLSRPRRVSMSAKSWEVPLIDHMIPRTVIGPSVRL